MGKHGEYKICITLNEEDGERILQLSSNAGISVHETVEGIIRVYLHGKQHNPGFNLLVENLVKLVEAYKRTKRRGLNIFTVKSLVRQGYNYTAIGKKLGVHRSTIKRAMEKTS